MRFGPVPVADATGGILAHTHRLPQGGALKKGRILTEADIERLTAAGVDRVVVARLDRGDLSEDDAAARLARAAAGEGVRFGEASTGRCNLYATRRGLLGFDPAQVDRANLVDEALTVGTLPRFSVVEAGEMVATVKVIPFAVSQASVERCLVPMGGLLKVHRFQPRRAGLIITVLPGVHEKQLERAVSAQRARVSFLDGEVVEQASVPHDEASVAEAIRGMYTRGCNPILVLGASAIVDRGDVVPQAVQRAGGTLVHMGMPVDPGNLMLLGRWRDTDIIGVPGCARSLKPSGYDWVLQRLAAGLTVTREEIMRMGAGGLLNEIRSRPTPRRSVDDQAARPNVVGLVMAAGRSTRMGPENKLLADVDGMPMVVRVVRTLLDAGLERVVVVVGHEAEKVQGALVGIDGVEFAVNPDFAQGGLSTSLRAGIRSLDTDVDGALVALGDMPWVRPDHVRRLLGAFAPDAVCVPIHNRKRGHPVLWSSRFFAEFEKLTGDVGARHLLEQHADDVRLVDIADHGVHVDVDTPEALQELRRSWAGS